MILASDHATLHEACHLWNGFFAIVFDPSMEDGYQTVHIEVHEIGAFLLRHAEALKDRGKDGLEHQGIGTVQLKYRGVFPRGAK